MEFVRVTVLQKTLLRDKKTSAESIHKLCMWKSTYPEWTFPQNSIKNNPIKKMGKRFNQTLHKAVDEKHIEDVQHHRYYKNTN